MALYEKSDLELHIPLHHEKAGGLCRGEVTVIAGAPEVARGFGAWALQRAVEEDFDPLLVLPPRVPFGRALVRRCGRMRAHTVNALGYEHLTASTWASLVGTQCRNKPRTRLVVVDLCGGLRIVEDRASRTVGGTIKNIARELDLSIFVLTTLRPFECTLFPEVLSFGHIDADPSIGEHADALLAPHRSTEGDERARVRLLWKRTHERAEAGFLWDEVRFGWPGGQAEPGNGPAPSVTSVG
ncbi:MAG: hypothetical protein ACOZNI_32160 [Myxococcota bacterium]